MKKILILFLVIFVSACGREFDLHEPAFSPYMSSFMKEVPSKWRHHFGRLPRYSMFGGLCGPKAIACVTSLSNTKYFHVLADDVGSVLVVNFDIWHKLTKKERQYIIWHELGHVLFKRKDTYHDSQRYINLMYGRFVPNYDGRFLNWDKIKESMN